MTLAVREAVTAIRININKTIVRFEELIRDTTLKRVVRVLVDELTTS